jgi:hypothetical protein
MGLCRRIGCRLARYTVIRLDGAWSSSCATWQAAIESTSRGS